MLRMQVSQLLKRRGFPARPIFQRRYAVLSRKNTVFKSRLELCSVLYSFEPGLDRGMQTKIHKDRINSKHDALRMVWSMFV